MAEKLKIISLGGLNEIGKNMTVFEFGGEIIVEDCGYTTAWEEFRYQLKKTYGLPPFPVLYTADALLRRGHAWGDIRRALERYDPDFPEE